MGPRLVQLRRRYGLNQSQLGELCGVTKAAVSQWETGVSAPEMERLVRLRSKLDFSLDWLITGEEEVSRSGVISKERRLINRRLLNRRLLNRRKINRLLNGRPSDDNAGDLD
ncbi:MAG: helix-turn-helix domain-containing protein [Nitrosospira sp.]